MVWLYIINTEVPALGDSLSWDTNHVFVISLHIVCSSSEKKTWLQVACTSMRDGSAPDPELTVFWCQIQLPRWSTTVRRAICWWKAREINEKQCTICHACTNVELWGLTQNSQHNIFTLLKHHCWGLFACSGVNSLDPLLCTAQIRNKFCPSIAHSPPPIVIYWLFWHGLAWNSWKSSWNSLSFLFYFHLFIYDLFISWFFEATWTKVMKVWWSGFSIVNAQWREIDCVRERSFLSNTRGNFCALWWIVAIK